MGTLQVAAIRWPWWHLSTYHTTSPVVPATHLLGCCHDGWHKRSGNQSRQASRVLSELLIGQIASVLSTCCSNVGMDAEDRQ